MAQVLAPGGMFSVNHYGEAVKEYDFWEKCFTEAGLDISFALKKRQERRQADVEFEELLSENFDRVDKIAPSNPNWCRERHQFEPLAARFARDMRLKMNLRDGGNVI